MPERHLRAAPGRDLSGERGWVKTKNRGYWRWGMECEAAFKPRRERQFV